MKIMPKTDEHNTFVRHDLIAGYGSEHIISITKEYPQSSQLKGFVAEEAGTLMGVLLYNTDEDECELVYLHVLTSGQGIGKMLLQKLLDSLREQDIQRLWVITTNDNLEALAFYQKQGFKLRNVYPDAMDQVRKVKPFTPLTGKNGIPLRDMIELEMKL